MINFAGESVQIITQNTIRSLVAFHLDIFIADWSPELYSSQKINHIVFIYLNDLILKLQKLRSHSKEAKLNIQKAKAL